MDLLLVTDGNKSHYVYMNDFDRFIFQKQPKILMQKLFTVF